MATRREAIEYAVAAGFGALVIGGGIKLAHNYIAPPVSAHALPIDRLPDTKEAVIALDPLQRYPEIAQFPVYREQSFTLDDRLIRFHNYSKVDINPIALEQRIVFMQHLVSRDDMQFSGDVGQTGRWTVKPFLRTNVVVSDMFLIPENAPLPQGFPEAPGVTMFTHYSTPTGEYSTSLSPIRLSNTVYKTTNTELCQMLLQMQVEAKVSNQEVAIVPDNHTFQEVYCNSLAMAITAAENGVRYTDYIDRIGEGKIPVFVYQGKQYPALPFNEDIYNQMQQLIPLYY